MSAVGDSIAITRIQAGQGQLLRELRLRSLSESPTAFGQGLEEARARPDVEWQRSARQSSHGDNRTWLLAQTGDDIVGIVQGRRRRPATLLLFSMWIEPARRRQGLGRRLIATLEAWGHGWDATETILWVHRGNGAALRFYEDLGFKVVESGTDAEAGSRFDALAMRRLIDPSRL